MFGVGQEGRVSRDSRRIENPYFPPILSVSHYAELKVFYHWSCTALQIMELLALWLTMWHFRQ